MQKAVAKYLLVLTGKYECVHEIVLNIPTIMVKIQYQYCHNNNIQTSTKKIVKSKFFPSFIFK